MPLGQFYEIGADNSMPYKICGGLQDNNTWCGPSQTMNPRGITNDDWYTIGGGDGFLRSAGSERSGHRLCRIAGRKPVCVET